MKPFARLSLGVLVAAFVSAGVIAIPAAAEDKAKAGAQDKAKPAALQATQKVLAENDRVAVVEAHFLPGAMGANTKRPMRVIHVLKGGTIERNYADGKKSEKVEWKTGETRILGADPEFAPKNISKSEVVLLVVNLK